MLVVYLVIHGRPSQMHGMVSMALRYVNVTGLLLLSSRLMVATGIAVPRRGTCLLEMVSIGVLTTFFLILVTRNVALMTFVTLMVILKVTGGERLIF